MKMTLRIESVFANSQAEWCSAKPQQSALQGWYLPRKESFMCHILDARYLSRTSLQALHGELFSFSDLICNFRLRIRYSVQFLVGWFLNTIVSSPGCLLVCLIILCRPTPLRLSPSKVKPVINMPGIPGTNSYALARHAGERDRSVAVGGPGGWGIEAGAARTGEYNDAPRSRQAVEGGNGGVRLNTSRTGDILKELGMAVGQMCPVKSPDHPPRSPRKGSDSKWAHAMWWWW
jgi:hypothetical protein